MGDVNIKLHTVYNSALNITQSCRKKYSVVRRERNVSNKKIASIFRFEKSGKKLSEAGNEVSVPSQVRVLTTQDTRIFSPS